MSAGAGAAPAHRLTEYGICTALAGWLVITLVAQHPNLMFHRLSRIEPTGLAVPNWRFFAPNPATIDYHLFHRVLEADGTQSGWSQTIGDLPPRRWHHLLWDPDRRRSKAIFDICGHLLRRLHDDDVTKMPGYHKIRDLVSVSLAAGHEGPPPIGFQFMLVTHTGYDDEPEPVTLFTSGLEPWRVHELAAL